MIDNRNRTFHYAVLASLALHAASALYAFPDLVDTARRAASLPPQIIARLMEPEPAPAPPVPEKPAAAPETPPPRKPRSSEAARGEAAAQPEAPVVRDMRPEPRCRAQRREPPAPAAPPSRRSSRSLQRPRHRPASPSPAQAPESLSRDQYRVQLIDEARRHKRYPPLARENNWQGDVRVGVAVAANGGRR